MSLVMAMLWQKSRFLAVLANAISDRETTWKEIDQIRIDKLLIGTDAIRERWSNPIDYPPVLFVFRHRAARTPTNVVNFSVEVESLLEGGI